MILKIYQDDAPVLHKRSVEIKNITPELKRLIEDMKETMYAAPGVGLAAPQVGQSIRLIVTDPSKERNDFRAFINPKIVSQKGPMLEGLEGCLSVSKWEGFVERFKIVTVSYRDVNGEHRKEIFEDFPARVVQHELDHLNGILFTERVKDGKLYTKQEIQKMLEENRL
jgi:peptide deformylase